MLLLYTGAGDEGEESPSCSESSESCSERSESVPEDALSVFVFSRSTSEEESEEREAAEAVFDSLF
jgi:hypothetical protein